MAIIFSYPTVIPTANDLVLGTDVDQAGKPTKNFTIQSIVDLIVGGTEGLGAVLASSPDGGGLNIENVAAVTGSGGFTAFSFTTTAGAFINETVGGNLTSFQSTSFTGKLDQNSFNQDNIRTLGVLTDLKVGNAAPVITSIVTAFTNPGDNIKLATTKAIVDYIATKPNPHTLAETLGAGELSGGVKNIVMQGAVSNITFEDSDVGGTKGRALFGDKVGGDLEIHHDGTDSFITDLSTGDLRLRSDDAVKIQASTGGNTLATFTKAAGVDLYFANDKKFETLTGGAKVTGVTTSTGVFQGPNGTTILPTYGFTGDVNTGMYGNGNGEVKLTSNGNTHYTFANGGATFTNGTTPPSLFLQSDTFTTTTTTGLGKITRFILSTDGNAGTPELFGVSGFPNNTMIPTTQAVKDYADLVAGAKILQYRGDTSGPFDLNLTDDDFKIAGGTNIGTVATDILSTIGTLTVNLNDNVTLPVGIGKGTYTGTKYTDTVMSIEAGAGTAFKSITTTLDTTANNTNGFFGPLRVNAASTNYSAGVADEAVKLKTLGDISPIDDVISYPATSGTVKVQAAAGVAVEFQDGAGENNSIVYPVIGQVVTGTSIVAGTKVASISAGALVLDTATSGALVAGATLNFAASTLDIYTSGGNVRMPSFIPSTVATSKYLTNLPTPTSSQILSTDTILSGMAKLQGQITATSGLSYEGLWNATTDDPALSGTTPANGVFYIVNVAGNTSLSGITDWLVGDWAIYVSNGSATDGWQKLDMTSDITGTGANNKIAKWTGPNTLDTGLISDDATVVTIGATGTGNFLVEGTTTLGGSATTNTLVSGPLTASKNIIINEGISLGSGSTLPYGDAGDVLTSGGSASAANTWTTPTTGTVTSVVGISGITVTPLSGTPNPIVQPDYLGANNIVLSAGTAVTPVGADTIIINDATTGNVVKALISSLPFTPAVSGAQYTIPMFATSTTLGNSMISQDVNAQTVTIDGGLKMDFDIFMDDNRIKEISELSFGANAYITSPSNFLVRFNSTSVDIPDGNLTVGTIDNATTDTDKFLVSDSGEIKYRTGAEVLSDIGAAPVTGGAYLPLAGGTLTGPLTGTDATFSGTVSLASDKALILGNTPDSKIFFDDSASVLADATVIQSTPTAGIGTILLQSYNVKMRDQLGTSNMFHATRYGVILYYDGDVKLTTTSSGINLNGFGSGTKSGTAAYNLGVDSAGDVIETNANPGGSGGGIFSGDQLLTFPAPTVGDLTFTLNRATTGTLIFDVWFTSETSTGTSVAKKYTVAHAYATDPVYNKIIDTGPMVTAVGASNDFTVSFANAGSGLSVTCNIEAGGIAQNIGYTVQVGHDSTNALTFTPAS